MRKEIEKIKNKKERVLEDQDTRVSGNPNTSKTLSNFNPDIPIS
jgi:hypothetical protein